MASFSLSIHERAVLRDWCKTLNPKLGTYDGAIGGRLTYSFSPTSLGTIVKVYDAMSKTEIDLTDYESW